MKIYVTLTELVIDLQERKFTEDFELFDDGILWIQQKTFLSADEFVITEYHSFLDVWGNKIEVFGMMSVCQSIKGILINRIQADQNCNNIIIESKIEILSSVASSNDDDFITGTFIKIF